jgi:hypothetical protein
MLYREIIAVCSQIHTNTLCGLNAESVTSCLAVRTVTTGAGPVLPSTPAPHRAVPAVPASSNPNSLSLQMLLHASNVGQKTVCPEIRTFCQAFRADCRNTTLKIVPWHALCNISSCSSLWTYSAQTDCAVHSPQATNKKPFSLKEKGHSFCAVISSCGNYVTVTNLWSFLDHWRHCLKPPITTVLL